MPEAMEAFQSDADVQVETEPRLVLGPLADDPLVGLGSVELPSERDLYRHHA